MISQLTYTSNWMLARNNEDFHIFRFWLHTQLCCEFSFGVFMVTEKAWFQPNGGWSPFFGEIRTGLGGPREIRHLQDFRKSRWHHRSVHETWSFGISSQCNTYVQEPSIKYGQSETPPFTPTPDLARGSDAEMSQSRRPKHSTWVPYQRTLKHSNP